MAAGLILALGTTRLWMLADAWLLLYTVYHRERFKTHPAVLAVAGVLLLTGLWSPDPLAGALAAMRVVCLYSAARSLKLTWRFWGGAAPVLAVQVVLMLLQLPENQRPWGLSMNASVVGQSSLAFAAGPLGPLAAVALGLSTARSAALGMAVYALLKRTRYAFAVAALACAVFVATALLTNPYRLGFSHKTVGIIASIDQRVEGAAQGVAVDPSTPGLPDEPPCGEVRERHWSWQGYGYHGYCLSTGLQRPHNLFVVSWWEMGVFAVPFWGAVSYGAWRLRNPMLFALLAVGMITEEMFSRPEGFYLAAVAMASQLRPSELPVPHRIRQWSQRLRPGRQASESRA